MPSTKRNRKYYGDSEPHIWPEDHPKIVKRHAKKDTRRWCKGRIGMEHRPFIDPGERVYGHTCSPPPDWWTEIPIGRRELRKGTVRSWWCHHRERCTNCGKILREGFELGIECPDYPGAR